MNKGINILVTSLLLTVGSSFLCAWSGKAFTKEEVDLVCKTVSCEANTQDAETQYMVALTILNRLENGNMGDSIHDVVYYKNAYSVTKWKTFEETDYSETTWLAVLRALEENTHPKDMYYFRTNHYHKFGQPYMVSDDLYFSTED